jgi:hypothetical protein
MKTRTLIAGALVGCISIAAIRTAKAQVAYDGTALNYSQTFDALGTSTATWSDNSTLPGWYLNSATLGVPASLAASTGGNSTGAAYNLGVAGVNPLTDRALGWLTTSTVGTAYIGLQLQNTSGQDYVGDVTISLSVEQWSARNSSTAQAVFLDDKANLITTGNQLASPSWTQLAGMTSPIMTTAGAIDGNAAADRVNLTQTVTFTSLAPWQAGSYLWFRARDVYHASGTGNNDMMGIDDVSVTIAAIPEPATLSLAGLGSLLWWLGQSRRHRSGSPERK